MVQKVVVSLWTVMAMCACVSADGTKKVVDLGASQPPMISSTSEKALSDFRYSIANMADKVLPVIVSIQTEAPAQPQPAAQLWYYCDSAKGYYPYVANCQSGWRTVPAQPPQAPPR